MRCPAPVMQSLRERLLRAVVLAGVILVLITELLGAFSLLRRLPLILCWASVVLFVLARAFLRRSRSPRAFRPPAFDPVVGFCIASCAAILALTAIVAAASPPNSSDAMAYHMPRVVYWAEQQSVRFFPTPYLNQIMLQPLAEYLMLHTYILARGDSLANFGQWLASAVSIAGASAVASLWNANARGQALAALFCATLPAGILASTGAKNDYFMAMWLLAAVYFALRFASTLRSADAALMGAALGLALLTKATAYLFAPWLIAAALLSRGLPRRSPAVRGILLTLACALAINTPLYLRNLSLSGSPLGFDSAQANGLFRWRNERFGWKTVVSNILRNASDQLGSPRDASNRWIGAEVERLHSLLAIDINDPATTWPWTRYQPPRNSNHESDAPNRLHLLLLVFAFALLVGAGMRHKSAAQFPLWYSLALAAGFVSFCAYLKWQPFQARLLLPLFVLASPLAAVFGFGVNGDRLRLRLFAQAALCLLLLDTARHPVLDNWVRPLRGPRSVLRLPRSEQYFSDMNQWHNAADYRQAVDLLASGSCTRIGIDINNFQLEYPLQALLRLRKPAVAFLHTGVSNPSARYPQPVPGPPCAVACLNCSLDPPRLASYRSFPVVRSAGRFVILSRP